jgi:hypothetical protein
VLGLAFHPSLIIQDSRDAGVHNKGKQTNYDQNRSNKKGGMNQLLPEAKRKCVVLCFFANKYYHVNLKARLGLVKRSSTPLLPCPWMPPNLPL